MKKKSLLMSIKSEVEKIEWESDTLRSKAYELCAYIYTLYVNDGGDFYRFKSLSKQYFLSVIKTQSYVYPIKNKLIEEGILEVDHSYDVNRKIAKGYRFNRNLVKAAYGLGAFTAVEVKERISKLKDSKVINEESNSLSLPVLPLTLYHICGTKINDYIIDNLRSLKIDPKVYSYIESYKLDVGTVQVNENIKQTYLNVQLDNGEYRFNKNKALLLAQDSRDDLILYKEKAYIENLPVFLWRKSNELKTIFTLNIFDLENQIHRVSRNDTNHRLDYNLTNIKSELLDYLTLDGEHLVELDVANCQFGILANLDVKLDPFFVHLATKGLLYEYVSKSLNISLREAKAKMFRVAFDKVKSEQDDVRELFPITMEYIDNFKKENGYKAFSIMLQKNEANLFIDYLLPNLMDEFKLFTIHDAFRVKASEADLIEKRINQLLDANNIKIKLRKK